MTTRTIIATFLLICFINCNRNDKTKKPEKASLKIAIEVIPENDSSYSISWEDTIGQSKGYNLLNRPFEVWCILKDTKNIVGYYKGLSTPSNFTYFTTKDSLIKVTFMIGPNFFSNIISEEERKNIYERKVNVMEFNPINLNIKNDLRKTLKFIIMEK